MENLRDNNIKKNAERKNNSEVEKVGRDVNWNLTDLILNDNKKYSNLINVGTNQTNSNQTIAANSKNIGSIHD